LDPEFAVTIPDAPDEGHEPLIVVCTVEKTVLHYDLRILDDMHSMLTEHDDWMELSNADEQKQQRRARRKPGLGRTTTRSVAGTA
jgi:hypothetical protein